MIGRGIFYNLFVFEKELCEYLSKELLGLLCLYFFLFEKYDKDEV